MENIGSSNDANLNATVRNLVLSCAAKPWAKYFGISLILGWQYSFWDVPGCIMFRPILDAVIIKAWLIYFGVSAFFMLLIPLLFGQKRRLSSIAPLRRIVPVVHVLGSLAYTLLPVCVDVPAVGYAVIVVLGMTTAVMWILWGEAYASRHAGFSLNHMGSVIAFSIIASMLFTYVLPPIAKQLFVAALPAASGAMLLKAFKIRPESSFPRMLAKSTARQAIKPIVIVSVASFVVCGACYFLAAIVPWEQYPGIDAGYSTGIVVGGLILLALVGASYVSRGKLNIFRLLPWMLVLVLVLYAAFLEGPSLYGLALSASVAVSGIMEILLIVYYGALTQKGYVTPALAFGVSGACTRLGTACGDVLALSYEANHALYEAMMPETVLVLMCVVGALTVSLTRQQYDVLSLTAPPQMSADVERICGEIAAEFGLSAREGEVLELIAKNYTGEGIAKALVISPHTVNAHIRHIYKKMDVHRHAELMEYINIHRHPSMPGQ